MNKSPIVQEEHCVLFSAKVTPKSREFIFWIYFMTISCVSCLLLWTILQFYALSAFVSGPIFLASLVISAICSAPYRAAKRLKNSPLQIILTPTLLILSQSRRNWIFERSQIQKIEKYATGPLYGLAIQYEGKKHRWPFVESAIVEKIKFPLESGHASE